MLPIEGIVRFPFRPEQCIGQNDLHPGTVGHAREGAVIGPGSLGLQDGRGRRVGEQEGVVPGRPEHAADGESPDRIAEAAEHIPFRAGADTKTRFFGEGRENGL